MNNAIKEPTRTLRSKVDFGTYINLTDDEIVSIEIDHNLCSTSEFEIGTAPMATASIDIKWDEDTEHDYEDKECDIYLGIMLPNETVEYAHMGKFTVEKATVVKRNLSLKLVDRMYKASKDFEETLTYPTTVLTVLQEACSQSGLSLAAKPFANASMPITEEVSFHTETCRSVMASVAELAGGWAIINSSGQVEIITLDTVSKRDITESQYIDFTIDEVANSNIDKVVVNVGEISAERGVGEDVYHVVNNMFVQDPALAVQGIYDVLQGTHFTAGTVNWQGDFTLKIGDRVTVNGKTFNIINRNLSYSGGLREQSTAPAVSNLMKDTNIRGSVSLLLDETLTEFKLMDGRIESTVSKADEAYSLATQTAEGLTTKVSAGDIASSINQTAQSVKIDASKINLTGLVTVSSLGQYGTTTIHGNRIETGTITSNHLASTYITSGDLSSTLGNYPTNSQLNTALNSYPTKEQLTTETSTTLIHGGNIRTDSITARCINVGELSSIAATIGGFSISDSVLSSGSSSNYVVLSSNPSDSTFIRCGGNTYASSPFAVSKDGTLKATKGEIGGWTIQGGTYAALYYGTAGGTEFYVAPPSSSSLGYIIKSTNSSGDLRFSVNKGGNVFCANLEASGTITSWGGSSLNGTLQGTLGAHSGSLGYTTGHHSGALHGTSGYHNGTIYSPSGTLAGKSFAASGVYMNLKGNLMLGSVADSFSILTYGKVYGNAFVNNASDIYYKENVVDPNKDQLIKDIYSVDIKEYNLKTKKDAEIGVIANDVIVNQKELAKYTVMPNPDNRLCMSYHDMHTISILAIQDLNERLKKLEEV